MNTLNESKTLKLELSDADIISMDDNTGNITVGFIENVSEGDTVEIHFKEDESNISHMYRVSLVDGPDSVISLDWIEMLDKTLNEAKPFLKSKEKAASRRLEKAKNAQSATSNLSLKAILTRDLKKGEYWRYYIQLPDGSYVKKPLAMKDIKSLYSNNILSPAVVNAVVTTDTNWVVRQGLRDFHTTGTEFKKSMLKIDRAYSKDWTDQDKQNFKEFLKQIKGTPVEEIIKNSSSKSPKIDGKKDSQKQTSTDPTESTATATEQQDTVSQTSKDTVSQTSKDPFLKQNQGITKPIIDKFRKLAMATGLEVLDAFDKPVNMSSAVSVGKITPETLIDYTINIKGKNYKLSDWLVHAVKNNILSESCDVTKFLLEDLLIEEPVIKFDDSELVDPTESPIKTAMSRAVEQDRIEKEKKEKEEQETALKVKYQDIISLFAQEAKTEADPLILLDMLFAELVPPSGAADTQAGELIRAIVRIMYRDSNDGDKFFEGYGIETCGSSAEYLYDNGFESEIQAMIDNMYQLADDDDKYTAALNHVAAKIVERIKTEPELIYTPNTEDSRDYTNDYIKENQPRYEYEISGSDDLVTLVENGTLTSWDLNDYVENILSYERDYEGAEVSRPWGHHDTSVTVENLTRDGYDRLKDSVEHNIDEFWSDLVNEHIDDLESDEELDDDYDSIED